MLHLSEVLSTFLTQIQVLTLLMSGVNLTLVVLSRVKVQILYSLDIVDSSLVSFLNIYITTKNQDKMFITLARLSLLAFYVSAAR